MVDRDMLAESYRLIDGLMRHAYYFLLKADASSAPWLGIEPASANLELHEVRQQLLTGSVYDAP